MNLRCPNCDSAIDWEPGQTSTGCPTCGQTIGFSASQMSESSESVSTLETQSLASGSALAVTAPSRIGRYQVVEYLGHGGFGTVYRCYDDELQRDVAIKVPRPGRFGSESAFLSFIEEARVAAALKHPAIVTIYDIGCDEDVGCFIAMEYVDGDTLARLLQNGQLEPDRVVSIVAPIARAVHEAHRQGIVHRDLKPANIIIDADGQPHVLDFGLGLSESEQWDRHGEVVGTPAYMPPEQIRGETPATDGRADIWSLGVILYQSLTGRLPFSGKRQHLRRATETYDPKPLRQIDDSIPIELEEVTLKCLAKSPRDRYATAGDLGEALEKWRQVRTAPVSTNGTLNRFARGLAVCGTFSLLLLAVFAVGSLSRDDPADSPPPSANAAAQQGGPSANAGVAPVIRAHALNDMLAREPKEVMFPHAQPAAVYKYDAKQHAVTLVSRSDSIFLTGNATVRDFEIRVGIACNQPPGGTGLIFGVNPEPGAKDEWVGQGVLLKEFDSKRFLVARYAVRLEPYRDGSLCVGDRQLLRSEYIDAPDDDECMLTINVNNGALESIRWENQLLTSLCKPAVVEADLQMRRPVPLLNTGQFGLWNYFGGATFQNHYYVPQEEER